METPLRTIESMLSQIEKRPGVCGGAACVVRTRIPVWTLVQGQRLGLSEAELLAS